MPDPIALGRKIREALAPCRLGRWPTPLEPLAGLDAWVKREDRSAPHAGGSKVRGLEFLLAGAPAGTVFLTVGGTGSTHCLLTAVHARNLGYKSALAQFLQPDTDAARTVAAATLAAADVLERARSPLSLPFAIARAWRRARPLGPVRWIPGGGAQPRAVAGHLLAALELSEQLTAPPDAVVLPLGTGGTAAGVTLGVAALGWPTRVVAVRVAPAIVANRWRCRWLASRARRLLANSGVPLPEPRSPVVVDGLGRGYGHPTAAGESARRLAAEHGLVLESTYGAKAFAILVQRAAYNVHRAVFWHTFAAPPPAAVGGGR